MGRRWLFFPASGFSPSAVTFDGTNDYQSRGGDWTSSADSDVGIWSCWLKHGDDGVARYIMDTNGSFSLIQKLNTNKIRFLLRDVIAGNAIDISTNTARTAASGFHHYMVVWNRGAGTASFYVDGVDDSAGLGTGALTVDWTRTDHFIGAQDGGLNRYFGDVAEWYLNTAETLSAAAALPKFYNAGRPVYLGVTGQLPTGNTPMQCNVVVAGAAASTFGTNIGSGGGDTITGAYTLAVGP